MGFRGAMVARLTPDQEAACSNHVEITILEFSRNCLKPVLLVVHESVRIPDSHPGGPGLIPGIGKMNVRRIQNFKASLVL